MTYTRRERKERKAERLREWADKRDAKACALRNATPDTLRHDWAFITQPGPIRERTRMWNRDDRARAHSNKAAEMRSRADGIEAQADHAIYSDDHDAVERLQERIAGLEAERDRVKAFNASCRKGERNLDLLDTKQQAEIASVEQYQAWALKKGGGFPAYHLSNLSGNISRLRKRLATLGGQS